MKKKGLLVTFCVQIFLFGFLLTTQVHANNNEQLDTYLLSQMKKGVTKVPLAGYVLDKKTSLDVVFSSVERIKNKYPNLYFYSGDVTFYWGAGKPFALLKRSLTNEQIASRNKKIMTTIKPVIETAKTKTTDVEKIRYVHNWVVNHVTYDKESFEKRTGPNSIHNIDGAIVDRKAVCDGYARTMQYILNSLNIKTEYVEGTSFNPKTKEKVPHAWVVTNVNNKWYYIDPTWNDWDNPGDGNNDESLNYFLVPESVMKKDHIWSRTAFPNGNDSVFSNLYSMDQYIEVNGTYYYSTSDGLGFYSIDKDGKNKKKLLNGYASNLIIKDDIIYFVNYADNQSLYTFDHVEGTFTKLTEFKTGELQYKNGNLYFLNTAENVRMSIPI
ncbi:MAG: DUF5050 domain-containing protein [Bacilli bacterium]